MSKQDNIFLVGLMGAGKTTVGRLLARQLGKTFLDADHEIEARCGVKIPIIFEIEGEAGFRKREEAVIAELVERHNIVLGTGGGAVLSPASRSLLSRHGTVVYLRGTPEQLFERTRHDRNRPLLQTQDPLARLGELYRQRDPLYREIADLVMDTGRQSVGSFVRLMHDKLALSMLPGVVDASTPLRGADERPHTSRIIDVFNGDADGLCALHQLRLAEPADSILITGPKREISLLKRVDAQVGDRITVLDIALSKNLAALENALSAGASVRYFDHHQPGDIPQHPAFEAHIDTSAETCTSLLVNDYLQGRFLVWAVVAAFGDNLAQAARRAAVPLNLSEGQLNALQTLGECLNYNGYGEMLDDLHYPPDQLYRIVQPYRDPFEFIATEPAFALLKNAYAQDMALAEDIQAEDARSAGRIFVLPAEKWARRISGVLGNQLATASPAQAHAVLTRKPQGGFVVSVRAPMQNKSGADDICSQFETGGGRKGAAGINHLPEADYARFINVFFSVYTQT